MDEVLWGDIHYNYTFYSFIFYEKAFSTRVGVGGQVTSEQDQSLWRDK